MLLLFITTCGLIRADDGAIAPTQRTPLFNGKDLSGLYTFLRDTKREDPRGVFSVRDGLLRISGDGYGYISTKRSYRNYRLVAEFKWGERNRGERVGKARDSGIFLHTAGPDGNSLDADGAYKAAIECQIMEGSTGDFLLIKGRYEDESLVPVRLTTTVAGGRDAEGWVWWKRDGRRLTLDNGGRVNWFAKAAEWRDVFGFRGRHDVESKPGEWTRVECICAGNGITVMVNGTIVNRAENVFPAAGPILLQSEGSEILFRRVELHPLREAATR
jgi:hypothetical protein